MKGKRGMRGDSLELLLDTVCSMFGAITLIAILVGLLANTGSPSSSARQATADMTRRRIATAEADLKGAESLKERLAKPKDSQLSALIADKRKLEDAVQLARTDEASVRKDLLNAVEGRGIDLNREWKKLADDSKAMQRRVTEASNAIKTQEQNTGRLQSRIKEIGAQIAHEKAGHVVKLRFPREREKTKQPYPIICKFGKVYPVRDASMQENTQTIKWVNGARGKLSIPIESSGWTIEKNEPAINGMLGDLSASGSYVILIVYPDSFDAYHGLRDRITASKLDFGLSIEPVGANIYWGEDGQIPPPL
jgi:hypothetical protein